MRVDRCAVREKTINNEKVSFTTSNTKSLLFYFIIYSLFNQILHYFICSLFVWVNRLLQIEKRINQNKTAICNRKEKEGKEGNKWNEIKKLKRGEKEKKEKN